MNQSSFQFHSYQRALYLLLLAVFLTVCAGAALATGLPDIGFAELGGVLAHLFGFGPAPESEVRTVLLSIRLPRVLLAIIAGAGFALAGTGTQAALCNPLVSPSMLGLSSGAAFGAALAVLYGAALTSDGGQVLLMVSAFGMAMLAVGLAYMLASIRRSSRETVILAGVAVNFIFAGGTVLLQYLAPWQDLRAIVFWTVGSLWNAELTNIPLLGCIVIGGMIVLCSRATHLNALILGEETAVGVGVNVKGLRLLTLGVSALVSASIVAFTGAIGFIGLVAPHMTRALFGLDNRWLIPASMLSGALLLLIADTCSRMLLWPQELPVGIMTSMIGGPFFLFQLLRRKKDWWA